MARAEPPFLMHARALAACLLGDAGRADPAIDAASWARWLGATSPALDVTPAGAALFIGSVEAFVTLCARLASKTTVAAADTSPLRARDSTVSRDAWSGFLAVGAGWMSVAWATVEERERTGHCLASLDLGTDDVAALASTDIAPEALAATLQEWGIAAFAARAGEASRRMGTEPAPSLQALIEASGLRFARPLAGKHVLDCGHLVAAPWATALLALLGARVTAVAHPVRRAARRYGPEPLLLDLLRSEDRHRFAALCSTADLVIDNFRPRVWGNLGLDPVALGAALHLSLPAFGAGSPDCNRKSYGFQLEALFGVGEVPVASKVTPIPASSRALLDHAVGFAAAVVAVKAIREHRRGPVELSHVSLLETLEGTAP